MTYTRHLNRLFDFRQENYGVKIVRVFREKILKKGLKDRGKEFCEKSRFSRVHVFWIWQVSKKARFIDQDNLNMYEKVKEKIGQKN